MPSRQRSSARPIQKTWTHCPRCGSKATETGVNPFRCTECEYTHFFSPCTAVGAIIADAEDRVLLLVRGRDPGRGLFGLPGGFVDPGETAEQAMTREVLEETCLEVDSYDYLTSFPNQYSFGGAVIPVTDLFFVAQVRTFDGIEVQEGEIEACHFCHPSRKELDRMAFQSNRRALSLYLKGRRKS